MTVFTGLFRTCPSIKTPIKSSGVQTTLADVVRREVLGVSFNLTHLQSGNIFMTK